MNYTLNDNTAYGIYNGISSSDVNGIIHKEAEMLELSILDYSTDKILHALNHDPEIEEIARKSYEPYPAHGDWSDEYKARWDAMAAEGEAPGHGEVSEEIVRQKIRVELDKIVETVIKPRKAKEEAEQARRAKILSRVNSVETKERTIHDEGGETKIYTHRVLMPSGKTYIFTDRNVFDFGRVLMYNGMMLTKIDGALGWNCSAEGGGWEFRPTTENDEAVMAYRAAALYGFANSVIRM